MRSIEYIVPTKRRSMTRARAAKIFLREHGRCYRCGAKLRAGVDSYEIEHPDALALGGSDNDDDLRVICIPCHRPKTTQDRREICRRNRIVTKGWRGAPKRSRFACGKNSPWKKKINGQVERRYS